MDYFFDGTELGGEAAGGWVDSTLVNIVALPESNRFVPVVHQGRFI
jgi:hypothetical protein